MKAKAELIVALDVDTFAEVRKLVDKLNPFVEIYKVGSQLFTAHGPDIVRYIQAQGKRVFLDLKYHDIPNTVANAVGSAVSLSIPLEGSSTQTRFSPLFMLTVHTVGGEEMLRMTTERAKKKAEQLNVKAPLIVGITVLTSDANTDNIQEIVVERALLAKKCGLDGVVSSSQEAAQIRKELGNDFIIVTPGIRPKDAQLNDQKRVTTPLDAVSNGSNFLVVGRPIVKADDPRYAAQKILEEIRNASV